MMRTKEKKRFDGRLQRQRTMMRKKFLFLLSVASLMLMNASWMNTVQLEVLNKSGMKIAVKLVEVDQNRAYYFKIAPGDPDDPTSAIFEIEKGEYNMNVYYLEEPDTVYGTTCNTPGGATLQAERGVRVTVIACNRRARQNGEPGMVKYGRWRLIY